MKLQSNRRLLSICRRRNSDFRKRPRVSGLLFSSYKKQRKSANTAPLPGPRTFEEIPPAELRATGKLVSETLHLEPGTDEHLRQFGIFRLEAANRSGWHNAPGDPRQTGSERYAALWIK